LPRIVILRDIDGGQVLFPFFICLAALTGCDQGQQSEHQETVRVSYIVAVNNPLYYFANRLIGGEVEVRLPVPADVDPAQWQPSLDDLQQLQGAVLVLLNGAGYSPWLDKVSLATSRLIVSSEAAREQWIRLEGQVTHSHGPEGGHAHGGYAFTTWMDMSLAQEQAEAVAIALSARWPERATAVASRLEGLFDDLEALDRGYQETAKVLAGRQLIYSHPVYQYFERRYQLPGHSLHWEPGAMPLEDQWQELENLRTDDALFIWEAEPTRTIADRMIALGLPFVVINPAANRSKKDWLAMQRENQSRLQAYTMANSGDSG
jgi:zinc transport system substrate-binding protein